MEQCPRCNIQVNELLPIDETLKSKLQASGDANIPARICSTCIAELNKPPAQSSGGVLMAQEKAKEEHRLLLWKNRVSLIKEARNAMIDKRFSEAAVSYEKYLKILEIVFEIKKDQRLRPELFKESARTTELTVVASVYWDLLRIYDTNDKYLERMKICSEQLASFVQFTPIYPDIMNKAEAFSKTAKHAQIVKQFLKMTNKERPRCFVATSAFGPKSDEVLFLRNLRDQRLKKSQWGRRLTLVYYKLSPAIACLLDKQAWLKPAVRAVLRLMIKCVS